MLLGPLPVAQPKTKAAIAMIRNWRRGKSMTGNTRQLMLALCACIDRYREAHPRVSDGAILDALDDTAEIIKGMEDRPKTNR